MILGIRAALLSPDIEGGPFIFAKFLTMLDQLLENTDNWRIEKLPRPELSLTLAIFWTTEHIIMNSHSSSRSLQSAGKERLMILYGGPTIYPTDDLAGL
ncbi:hypothetical protein MNBD_ALPHA04-1141 [hydrothermal vent metagenome]|uniref:Uncharacterized protein n=1 Tax=hydrothermal vent metagenome TaxID=652676 RepID=A0A3B0SD52_9ZZZZ